MRRLLATLMLVILGLIAALLVIGADAPASAPSAASIATGLVVVWGFLAPLTVYKWIPVDDARMKAITIGVSLVIAVIALALSGGLKVDLSSTGAALVMFGVVYGESQFVWTLLKDHPQTANLVN